MVRQEVRHAYFLAYILSPHRPHGFRSAATAALLAAIVRAGAMNGPSLLDVHLADLSDIRVERERDRIDLLLDVPSINLVVAIELKIDARESDGQLRKYRKLVEERFPNRKRLFVFLTIDGDDPIGDEQWLPLQMEALAAELQRLCASAVGNQEGRRLLAAYLAMLRRHHMGDESLEAFAARLWEKHRTALEYLADRRPNSRSRIMAHMIAQRADIAAALCKQTGLTVEYDSHAGATRLRFAVKEWDDVEGMLAARGWSQTNRIVLAELVSYSNGAICSYVLLGPGDTGARESIFNKLKVGGYVKLPKNLGADWKRLASSTLIKATRDDEEEKSEIDTVTLMNNFVKAISPVLKAYDQALRPPTA